MTTVMPRWDNDERGYGIGDGSAHALDVRRLLAMIASPGWVAEDLDAHLLPKLSAASRERGSPWTLLSAHLEGAVYEVALEWSRDDAGIGRLRADAFALIGVVAEDSTHIRQIATAEEIRYEVTTGMLNGDSVFAGHGHLLRLIVRGEAANRIARSK